MNTLTQLLYILYSDALHTVPILHTKPNPDSFLLSVLLIVRSVQNRHCDSLSIQVMDGFSNASRRLSVNTPALGSPGCGCLLCETLACVDTDPASRHALHVYMQGRAPPWGPRLLQTQAHVCSGSCPTPAPSELPSHSRRYSHVTLCRCRLCRYH